MKKRNSLYSENFILESNKRVGKFPQSPIQPSLADKVKKVLLVVFFLASISISSYVAYNAYQYSKFPESIDKIPLIRADLSPLKISPQEPGGTKFSNQDKLIYRNLEDPGFKHKDDINKILADEIVMKEKNTLRTPARDMFAAKAKKEAKKPSKAEAKADKNINPFAVLEE